jgi:hypothetical protein
MLETESFAKVKAGGSMDCFVYDPANPPAPKKVIPQPVDPITPSRSLLGVEVFGGKLFSGNSLEDAKGVEKLLSSNHNGQQAQASTQVASPVEYLLRLKKDIQQLQEDANKAAPTDSLSKMRNLGQALDPILSDQRVAPYLPHISPLLQDQDPVEALIVRMRATEGVTFHAVGKQQRIQPMLMIQQVEALEKFVGPAAPNAPLRKRLSSLQRDVNVLDPAFLVSCSRRIKSMLTEVTLLDQQKRALETILPTEVQTRMDALNALNAKHFPAIQEVVKPHSTLASSNPSHEAAARVLQRLHALAQQQKLASELLNADSASLKMLSENLVANMKLMKANVSNIEQRLQAISRDSST